MDTEGEVIEYLDQVVLPPDVGPLVEEDVAHLPLLNGQGQVDFRPEHPADKGPRYPVGEVDVLPQLRAFDRVGNFSLQHPIGDGPIARHSQEPRQPYPQQKGYLLFGGPFGGGDAVRLGDDHRDVDDVVALGDHPRLHGAVKGGLPLDVDLIIPHRGIGGPLHQLHRAFHRGEAEQSHRQGYPCWAEQADRHHQAHEGGHPLRGLQPIQNHQQQADHQQGQRPIQGHFGDGYKQF